MKYTYLVEHQIHRSNYFIVRRAEILHRKCQELDKKEKNIIDIEERIGDFEDVFIGSLCDCYAYIQLDKLGYLNLQKPITGILGTTKNN